MTKEELAMKKGLKNVKPSQTAAESLITTKAVPEAKEVNDNPDKVKIVVESKPKELTPKKPAEESIQKSEVKTENITKDECKSDEKIEKAVLKVGRPKGRPSTKVSFNMPNDLIETVTIAAGIGFKGNTSSYIVSLIERDIEKNGSVYDQIKALKN